VIITLLLSFLFSIVFIPAIARKFLVNQRPVRNPVARIERRLAARAGRLAAYPSGNGPKGWAVGGGLAAFAIVMVMVGGSIAGTLGFSIFPAGKDAVAIAVNSEFPPGTTIDEAQEIADEVDAVVLDVLGDDLERSQYLRGNERLTETFVDLSPIGGRPTAPEFVEQIEAGLVGIEGARVTVAAAENGPPVLEFPFAAQIAVDDSTAATGQELAVEIRDDLVGLELEVGGDTVTILDAIVSTDGVIARTDGERFIEVRAQYDSDEVTGNLNATQDYLEDRYPTSELEARGLAADALGFDFGLESDNQDDFASLGVAGLVALLLMLVVITVQFRSLAQSLLIFLAIPFSFLGVFSILSVTDNPLSFLVTVGFIALIGVAVNNTILLVDAANRARRAGKTAGEAIQEAITRRFRPLVATTLTTVVGLLPLALSDPFWEALGFTLIGGLVSSTFFVLLAFPAFYLGLEAVRTPVRNLARRRMGKPEIV
jgi:multidrug efflux pump subunit AcrB